MPPQFTSQRRPNAAKQRLLAGQPAIGIFVSATSPLVAEAVGQTGLAWVCVDMQHGEANLGTLSPLLTAISATPAMPYARVPINDFKEIGRALDQDAERLNLGVTAREGG